MAMSVKIEKKSLSEALVLLGRVVPQKLRIPILGCIKVQCEGKKVIFSATNLEEFLSREIEAEGAGKGAFLLSFSEFRDFLKGTRKQDAVYLMALPEGGVRVADGEGPNAFHRVLYAQPVEEYPLAPVLPEKFEDCKADFLSGLRLLAPSVAADVSRKVLHGVYVDDGVMVATNGRQLVKIEAVAPPQLKAIIPATKILSSGALSGECQAGVAETEGKSFLTLGSNAWRYSLRLIEGTYPKYKQIIPDEAKLHQRFRVVNGGSMLALLPRFRLKGPEFPVQLVFEAGKCRIGSGNGDSIEVEAKYDGKREKLEVYIARGILQRALMLGHTEFLFTDELSPFIAKGGVGQMVFMAFRTGSYKPYRQTQTTEEKSMNKEKTTEQTAVTETTQANASQHASPEQFHVVSQVDPFDDLLKASEELRILSSGFSKKIREAQLSVKKRERDFKATRELLGKLKAASGF